MHRRIGENMLNKSDVSFVPFESVGRLCHITIPIFHITLLIFLHFFSVSVSQPNVYEWLGRREYKLYPTITFWIFFVHNSIFFNFVKFIVIFLWQDFEKNNI